MWVFSHQQTVLLPFFGPRFWAALEMSISSSTAFSACWIWATCFPPFVTGGNPGSQLRRYTTPPTSQGFLGKPPVNGDYMVPLIGGIGTIESPNWQGLYLVYKWYILPIGWLYATDPHLREPVAQLLNQDYETCLVARNPCFHRGSVESWEFGGG